MFLVWQDRKLAAQGFSPVTYSLAANACAYNSPELSNRSNNDTIYLSTPEMHNPHYMTLPHLATTLGPQAFQAPQSDGFILVHTHGAWPLPFLSSRKAFVRVKIVCTYRALQREIEAVSRGI